MDTIESLIGKATEYLDDLGYSEGTKTRYKGCWNCFKKYAIFKKIQDFTLEFGYNFLTDYYRIDFDVTLTSYQSFTVRAIKVLNDFSKHGTFTKCYQRKGLHGYIGAYTDSSRRHRRNADGTHRLSGKGSLGRYSRTGSFCAAILRLYHTALLGIF